MKAACREQQQRNNELKFTSEFKPSGVIMLDALRHNDVGELKTGLALFDQLRDMNDFQDDKQILCRRQVVNTADDLRHSLAALREEVPDDFAYILHLECHGGEGFIEIGDRRELMTWQEFMGLLTPLNVKNKCNVGLVLACCHGFGSFKVDDLAAPVPFYFQLSNDGVISAGVLQESLSRFYNKILIEHDLLGAIKVAAPFQMKYAEEMFALLIYKIMHSEQRAKMRQEGVNTILSGVLAAGGVGGNPEVASNRKLVKEKFGTFDQQIAARIKSHLSFFCGRKPAFELERLVAWISGGRH